MKMEITYKPTSAYTGITDVVNDAMDHRPCFVRGVEKTWQFVWTSTTEELQRLIGRREIRRAVEVSLPVQLRRPSATAPEDRSEVQP